MAISMISVSAQEDEEGEEASGKMTAVFVNEHPRDEITLYWVDHDLEEDDPERLVSTVNIYSPLCSFGCSKSHMNCLRDFYSSVSKRR